MVLFIPWRVETIIPAEIILSPEIYTQKTQPHSNFQNYTSHSIGLNQQMYIHPAAKEVVMAVANTQHNSIDYKVLQAQNVKLQATTSKNNALEVAKGQDAIFFPDNENFSPIYISVTHVSFHANQSQIKGSPLKVNQYFEGHIRGLLAIKGDRKSIFMRLFDFFLQW